MIGIKFGKPPSALQKITASQINLQTGVNGLGLSVLSSVERFVEVWYSVILL